MWGVDGWKWTKACRHYYCSFMSSCHLQGMETHKNDKDGASHRHCRQYSWQNLNSKQQTMPSWVDAMRRRTTEHTHWCNQFQSCHSHCPRLFSNFHVSRIGAVCSAHRTRYTKIITIMSLAPTRQYLTTTTAERRMRNRRWAWAHANVDLMPIQCRTHRKCAHRSA